MQAAPVLGPPVFDGEVTVRRMDVVHTVALIELDCPAEVQGAGPGTFVFLRNPAGDAPLLPRPLSVVSASDTLKLVMNVKGAGTRAIAAAVAGEQLALTGPMGNTFNAPDGGITMVVDASHLGGILGLATQRNRADDTVIAVTCGADSDNALPLAFADLACRTLIKAPEEVVPTLRNLSPSFVAASAIDATMAAVQAHTEQSAIAGETALHAMMACGLGACMGCVWRFRDDTLRLVCNGPVFSLDAPAFSA